MFIRPKDAEMMAVKNRKFKKPASKALFDRTAIPTTEVDWETVCAAVAGLNNAAIALTTMPRYLNPITMASQGVQA